MRIISWNCAMAFRKKVNRILKYKPDILVIQESECTERVKLDDFAVAPTSAFWFGDNLNKGVSIFVFNDLKVELIDEPRENDKWIIPLKVNGSTPFFAVWAMNHRGNAVIDKTGPTYSTFMRYQDYLKENVIIVGDFNDNKIWDKQYVKRGNFSDLASLLSERNIMSCYHEFYSEDFGTETRNSIFWRKNINTAYHIDYCFASDNLMQKMVKFELGTHKDWLVASDHVPMIIDFDI